MFKQLIEKAKTYAKSRKDLEDEIEELEAEVKKWTDEANTSYHVNVKQHDIISELLAIEPDFAPDEVTAKQIEEAFAYASSDDRMLRAIRALLEVESKRLVAELHDPSLNPEGERKDHLRGQSYFTGYFAQRLEEIWTTAHKLKHQREHGTEPKVYEQVLNGRRAR